MYPIRSRVGLPYVKVTLVISGNGKERERYNPNYFSPKILEKLTIDRQKKKDLMRRETGQSDPY